MGVPMSKWPTVGLRSRNANQHWKDRWGVWLLRSLLAAVGVHVLVLLGWPSWQIRRAESPPQPIELIQITPVAAYGGVDRPSEGTIAALPTLEEVELALEEARQGSEDEAPESSEMLGLMLPGEREPPNPEVVTANTTTYSLNAAELILERLSAIRPELIPLSPSLHWPQIRNPTIMRRYLRSRYNPLYHEPGATGMVSVALWINEHGSVEQARVTESSGSAALDEIAIALFQDVAAFAPARSGRLPVPVQVTISVPFVVPW